MKNKFIIKKWGLTILLAIYSIIAYAHTPTTDLSAHEPNASPPPGATFEWREGATPSSALVSTPNTVPPGLYYGYYNFGATTGNTYDVAFKTTVDGASCYSAASPIEATATSCTTSPTSPSSFTINNTCPNTTVNLTTAFSATNLPAGISLTWHTATPATTANLVSTPSAVGAGTYYAAMYDPVGNCYSSETAVDVSINSCTPITNTCPNTTVNLTTAYSATNLPAGISLTWHTATPATTANLVSTPSAVGAGTYYAAMYDPVGNCYSSETAVDVSINSCTPQPCTTGSIIPILINN